MLNRSQAFGFAGIWAMGCAEACRTKLLMMFSANAVTPANSVSAETGKTFHAQGTEPWYASAFATDTQQAADSKENLAANIGPRDPPQG